MTGPAREHGHGNQPQDAQPDNTHRRPDYVIVVSASNWVVKEHFPAAGANVWDALHTGKDRRRDPEPDLEAEA